MSIKADSDPDVKPIVDLAFGAIIHRIRKAGTRSGYRSSVPVGIGIDIGIGIGFCAIFTRSFLLRNSLILYFPLRVLPHNTNATNAPASTSVIAPTRRVTLNTYPRPLGS